MINFEFTFTDLEVYLFIHTRTQTNSLGLCTVQHQISSIQSSDWTVDVDKYYPRQGPESICEQPKIPR